jgi:hypothetical protein
LLKIFQIAAGLLITWVDFQRPGEVPISSVELTLAY